MRNGTPAQDLGPLRVPRAENKLNAPRRLALALAVIAAFAALSSGLSACSGRTAQSIVDDIREPVEQILTDSSSALESAAENFPAKTTASNSDSNESSSEGPSLDTTRATPSQSFDEIVLTAIRDALDHYQNKVILDEAVTQYIFHEDQTDELIDRVYALYDQVFRENAQYFWLDGSARIEYSILQTQTPTFNAMTLEMGYTAGYADASTTTLQARQAALLSEASRIAALANQAPTKWQQLQIVHDHLIRNTVYDTTLDQTTNNAASALLDHLTLCQGYAQSFQLITQQLGIPVTLITGNSEGVDHAWNLVWLDGQPYHIDVTHDDPVPDGGENDQPTHINFLRSDERMRQTHTWNTDDYPRATSDGAHYYRLQDLTAATFDELEARIAHFVSQADFSDNQPDLLEILYLGDDLPAKSTVEELLINQLRAQTSLRTITYRATIDKAIISLEVLPD
ncbi:MAG: transglutaminase domain-containing protein [Eubacteriales bacterium]|nr:transglutaminase domain-containing protein [Eubacteriales bacterium]